MQFAQPIWLLLGAIACALVGRQFRRFDLAQGAALAQFAAARLLGRLTSSLSPARRRGKRVLFILGLGLLFVALARSQAGFEWQETHRKGLALLFAIDTSKSMLAQDVKPDRLTRAKLAVTDLVGRLQGDGVGLIAFAGNAFLQCPVTLDYEAFRESLNALNTTTIPRGGTDIAAAIHEAEGVFKTRATAEKILVLMTDGEDLGGEGIAAAQEAAKEGVKIFTVGVGSAGGELVPVPNENGGTEFARDAQGEFVKSHLDAATLQKIADATGGMYQPLGAQGEGLAAIYDQGLAKFTREDLSSRQTKVPLERFQWPLLAALLCFVSELLIGNRRRIRAAKLAEPVKSRRAPNLRPAAAAVALLAGIAGTHAATPQSAEQAYEKRDFAKAQEEYAATAAKEPAKAELRFNEGASAYKAGDYAQAANSFQQSLGAGQAPVQHDAYYNLGNTQYRLGQKTEKENPQKTIETWESAVKSYDTALQIAANDADAKHNRDLVQRKIEQLKKQEEQKKQEQQQKQGNKDQKNDSKDQQQNQNQQDRKGGKQDQHEDTKDQQTGNGKSDAKQNESGANDKKNDAKDAKGDEEKKRDESQNPQAGAKNGEQKEQKAGAQAQAANEKKEQPATAANSGASDPPKPVNAEKKPAQGKVEAASGEKPEEAAAAAEERREPGQMTKDEATQLLDALKGDERKAPAISAQGRATPPHENKILKDW